MALDAELEEALRVYLDASPNGSIYPHGGKGRVRARYGAAADRVLARVEEFLHPLTEIPDAWAGEAYVRAGELAEQRARERNPDLPPLLAKAIGNYVSFWVWHG